MKYRHKIRLDTMTEITDFVEAVSKEEGRVVLKDGNDFSVNAKSVLGVLASFEWKTVYCESDADIYSRISKYITE